MASDYLSSQFYNLMASGLGLNKMAAKAAGGATSSGPGFMGAAGPVANWLSGLFSGTGAAAGAGAASGFAGLMQETASSAFGGFMAGGGTARAGNAYIVGEHGPEMFVPGQSGQVVPGGGSATVNMTVVAPDANSFRQSRHQVLSDMLRGVRLAQART